MKKLTLIGLCLILLVAGAWFFHAEKLRQADLKYKEFDKNQEQVLNGSNRNVRVSDGQVAFTFEVLPDWAIETRIDGEKSMTEQDMREFFKTDRDGNGYSDYTNQYDIKDIDTLNFKQLNDLFVQAKERRFPGYPNASVSPRGVIWYGEDNHQIDFYIVPETEADKYIQRSLDSWIDGDDYYLGTSLKTSKIKINGTDKLLFVDAAIPTDDTMKKSVDGMIHTINIFLNSKANQ